MHIDHEAIVEITETLRREGWSGDAERLRRLLDQADSTTAVRLFVGAFADAGALRDRDAVEQMHRIILGLAATYRTAHYDVSLGVPTITFYEPVEPSTKERHVKAVIKHRHHRPPENCDGRPEESRGIVVSIERWKSQADIAHEEILLV